MAEINQARRSSGKQRGPGPSPTPNLTESACMAPGGFFKPSRLLLHAFQSTNNIRNRTRAYCEISSYSFLNLGFSLCLCVWMCSESLDDYRAA
jgi:hypothetical protein